jgi:hypothetical protein
MKKNLQYTIILIMGVLLFSPALNAGVNYSMERVIEYKKKYGAYNPFFRTNKSGDVVAECWNAPHRMWKVKEALKFAKLLVPKKQKGKKPVLITSDRVKQIYRYSDGTRIIFKMLGGKCTLVGVYKASYKGPPC